ncbi:MAG: MBL fold metallo-hydrolase [bacterium]|nr:MBL fold metallo-hydrolase [bacterium]
MIGNIETEPGDKVVFLGTGTPNADPERSGPSVAIIANESPYIVDFGPGVVRRAISARLDVKELCTAFLTHLHSDHTIGLPDLMLTPWVLERERPLKIFGPPGTGAMADLILKAYEADIRERLNGLEHANRAGWRISVIEIEAGVIYDDDDMTVEAIPVQHGSLAAFGYKFSIGDRNIVISGDTSPTDVIAKKARNADILIHEVYSAKAFQSLPSRWRKYHSAVHTSTIELAEIAAKAKPDLLVLYHQLFWGVSEDELVTEVTENYDGKVVSANDLDIYYLE